MPLDRNAIVSRLSFVTKHFESKTSRFRCAVTLGFFIATAGFFATGPGAHALFADESVWGSLSNLFAQQRERAVEPAPTAGSDPRARRERHALHRQAPGAPRRSASNRHGADDPNAGSYASVGSGGQSVCVRLCDGYVFPVGNYRGDGDKQTHQATCQSACPDAATALYVMPQGSDKIDDAVQVGTGRSYSKLPDAFHYTTVLDDACTCHKAGPGKSVASILRDFTLRRGDAVMTGAGVKVFHGGGHFPYRRNDFVALSRSGDVRKSDRATFGAMERAGLQRPSDSRPISEQLFSNKAPTPPPAVLARARYQHQANRN